MNNYADDDNNNAVTNTINKGLGWIPDIPDARDHMFKITKPEFLDRKKALPAKIDLRTDQAMQLFPILDQGQLGSCTANAISAAMTFATIKSKKKEEGATFSQVTMGDSNLFIPSRLFIYYNERVMENSVESDSGAMIRDGIKSVNKQGAPKEATWPYNIAQFANKPSDQSYNEALTHQVLLYRRLDNRDINQLKGCLAQGFPFVLGFAVYDSFQTMQMAQSGIMPMPDISREQLLGGHAVLAVGYDDAKQWFIIRNSWGDDWGDKGYFYMPYRFITNTNYSDDFWTITLMEEEDVAPSVENEL
jgi:C1A family cysteine protease